MSRPDAGRDIFRQRIPLPMETLAFVALNLADVVLTHALLVDDPAVRRYESNVVAAAWIELAGTAGMVAFKFVLVAIILVICQMIHKYRPPVARRLLNFMCMLVAVVICYSLALILKLHMEAILTGTPAVIALHR